MNHYQWITADDLINKTDITDNEAVKGEHLRTIFWKIKGLENELNKQQDFWESTNTALEKAYLHLEHKTDQVKKLQGDLIKTSYQAGMSQVATSIIHNVGNILTSLNVSNDQMLAKMDSGTILKLFKIFSLLEQNFFS